MTNILIIGEAYGEAEEREQTPFVGASGHELTRMLDEAGIHRAECFLTNVFNLRPPGNKIESICGPKKDGIKGYPPLIKSKHIPTTLIPELERLGDEILAHDPNIIIALGNTPLWALTGKTGISKLRGTTLSSTHTASGYKLLPTYHPAAILRQWELRPTAIADLMKAARESAYPEIRRPARQIWIEPTLEDIHEFRRTHIESSPILSVDIETAGNQITCIGFAPNPRVGLVIPIADSRRKNRSYWPTVQLERQVWKAIAEILASRAQKKIFQNGLYDIAFLWRAYGIKVYSAEHDTMLCHHALQPESLKSLGFLGSIYTDEGSWKDMRKHSTTIKRDD